MFGLLNHYAPRSLCDIRVYLMCSKQLFYLATNLGREPTVLLLWVFQIYGTTAVWSKINLNTKYVLYIPSRRHNHYNQLIHLVFPIFIVVTYLQPTGKKMPNKMVQFCIHQKLNDYSALFMIHIIQYLIDCWTYSFLEHTMNVVLQFRMKTFFSIKHEDLSPWPVRAITTLIV